MPESVSIIICTRNRADSLAQTLESMRTVKVPAGLEAELIVADNGSTDHTAEVARSVNLRNISVRHVLEPRPGQCHARNSGIANAQGEVILFTDDDVRPPAAWLDGMCRPILSGDADAVAGGVRLAPHLMRDWMSEIHRSWLCSTESIDPDRPSRMVGANMAFSRSVLTKVPRFDEELGPGALGFGDDSLFARQLLEAGFHVTGALDVAVEHHCEPSRADWRHLLKAAVARGRTKAYIHYHWEHGPEPNVSPPCLRHRLGLWRRQLLGTLGSTRYQRGQRWELGIVSKLAFFDQYRHEAQRPRAYKKRGLVKVAAIPSCAARVPHIALQS